MEVTDKVIMRDFIISLNNKINNEKKLMSTGYKAAASLGVFASLFCAGGFVYMKYKQ